MQPLFTVETDRLRLTWSGPPSPPAAASPLVAAPLADRAVRLNGDANAEAPVGLVEETAYAVLVQSLDGRPVGLRHRDPTVTAGLVPGDGGRVLHGRISFGSQAGRTRVDLLSGGEPEVSVAVTVRPSKLSESEVGHMRAEVEAAAAGLAVAAVRPATLADGGGGERPSAPVWLAALRAGADALERAIRQIGRRPVLEVHRPREEVRADRIGRPSADTHRAARRRGGEVPTLPARPARVTSDTPAHRWLAARLGAVRQRLAALAREEGRRRPSARRATLLSEIADLEARLGRLARVAVLAEASGRPPAVPPLALRRRPAYAEAYDALHTLDRGLSLRDGALDVATQDLSVLYETWAALAVVRAVAEALGAEPPARPFGADARGADVRLRRGRAHAVRLRGTGVSVEIAYTPRFPAPPALLPQRPDLLLTVRRGGTETRVVLDAKYRRDDSDGYRRRYGAAGPPEDALNTLHRYRDAIPGVAVAAALFPGTGAAFGGSRLWTSLESLGVGAVPLRPGDRGRLAELIGGLVG